MHCKAMQGNARQCKAMHCKAMQGNARQCKAMQGKAVQGSAIGMQCLAANGGRRQAAQQPQGRQLQKQQDQLSRAVPPFSLIP